MNSLPTIPLFPAGQIVATPGALALLEQANRSPLEFLSRHLRGDWGDLCQDDKTENELSLKHLPQPAYPRRCPYSDSRDDRQWESIPSPIRTSCSPSKANGTATARLSLTNPILRGFTSWLGISRVTASLRL